MRKLTQEEWIQKAKEVHGNKYNYTLVDYKRWDVKVEIICSIHGSFYQTPNAHTNGQGCNLCGMVSSTNISKLGLEKFIKKSIAIHNNFYDYSLTEYNHIFHKVKIICPVHGVFEQLPSNHLKGCGCKKCKSSKGELRIRLWLESNKIYFNEQHKFVKCRNKLPLPFDFYLPELNCCIEFDGEQHYKPKSYSSDKSKETKMSNLKEIQHRDKIKDEYCRDNNIHLIRIVYKNIDSIEEILHNTFRNSKS